MHKRAAPPCHGITLLQQCVVKGGPQGRLLEPRSSATHTGCRLPLHWLCRPSFLCITCCSGQLGAGNAAACALPNRGSSRGRGCVQRVRVALFMDWALH